MSDRICLSLALVAATLAVGCDSFTQLPWRLDRTRVLAVRVEVAADPERSSPAPGETVWVRALVVDPAGDRSAERAFRFHACVAAADTRAGAGCAEPPFATLEGTGQVAFELAMPAREGRVLASGVVCTGGAPVETEAGPDCEPGNGESEREKVTFSILVSADLDNHHPNLRATPTLGGEPWSEGGGCADPATLRIPARRLDAPLAWELGPDARELVEGRREELLVSHVVTAGELDRYQSIVEPDEDPARVEVPYRLPPAAQIPAAGLELGLVLVVRDERGGVAWLRRSACVTPD